jgi:hypothetical protein
MFTLLLLLNGGVKVKYKLRTLLFRDTVFSPDLWSIKNQRSKKLERGATVVNTGSHALMLRTLLISPL